MQSSQTINRISNTDIEFEERKGMQNTDNTTFRNTFSTCNVSVKLHRPNGEFLDEIRIPSRQYPISGVPELFFSENTHEITDPTALRVFDSVRFRPGYCFSSADELVRKLRAAGYDAKTYVGWLFHNRYEYPTHHAWVVLGEGALLDTTDFTDLLREKEKDLENSEGDMRENFSEYVLKAAAGIKNSSRIKCPGTVPKGIVYCGAPDTAQHGREINRMLRETFPNHKAFVAADNNGMTKLQRVFYGGGSV